MYPPLGYHPDPDSIYNEPPVNEELFKIYEYCESHSVPITTHCSPGGAYSSDLIRAQAVRIEFTKPWSWAGVLKKFPNLYLNLAHFGQDMIKIKDPSSWAAGIRDLIRIYPNVYTDLAYNDQSSEAQDQRAVFRSAQSDHRQGCAAAGQGALRHRLGHDAPHVAGNRISGAVPQEP